MIYLTPGYVSKIDFVKPIGLKGKEYKAFFEKRNYQIALQKKIYLQHLEYIKRYNKLERIRDRIIFYHTISFVTFTFNDDNVSLPVTSLKNKIRYLFKKMNIEYYVLTEDYGKKSGRFHFHGFIDCEKCLCNFKYIGHRNGKVKYICDTPLGYLSIQIFKNYDYQQALEYSLKYSLKDDLKKPPMVFYSKKMPVEKKLLNFFGECNFIIEK